MNNNFPVNVETLPNDINNKSSQNENNVTYNDLKSMNESEIDNVEDKGKEEKVNISEDFTVGGQNRIPLSTPQSNEILRYKLKDKLLRYKFKYPVVLAAYDARLNMDYFDTQSNEQLEILLREIELCANCNGSIELFPSMFKAAMKLPEAIAPLVGLDLTGFGDKFQKNADIDNVLTEVALKYQDYCYIDPLKKLGFISLKMMMETHHENILKKEGIKMIGKSTVRNEIINQFQDL